MLIDLAQEWPNTGKMVVGKGDFDEYAQQVDPDICDDQPIRTDTWQGHRSSPIHRCAFWRTCILEANRQ